MGTYIALLRGINVGGKNKIPMANLRKCLEDQGFSHVSTLIASGNVILESAKHPTAVKEQIEATLIKSFKLDSELIKVLVLSYDQIRAIVANKPKGFGDQPDKYHSDIIFLMDVDTQQAMTVFSPREGVDAVWPGNGVVYSQRVSALRTKSRLNKIMGSPLYKSMTIRNWNTTMKLWNLVKGRKAAESI